MTFNAESIRLYSLNTVERYYSYMSQGNSFAPEFRNLTLETKQKWIEEFNTAMNEVKDA